MLTTLLIAAVLVVVTVVLHATGLALMFRAFMKSHIQPPTRAWPMIWLLVRVTWFLILIHVIEITVWALFYLRANCLPDAESAFYFSGVTYATIGDGNVVLPEPWRLLGPVEGLTGILMSGLSAGLFFALLARMCSTRFEEKPK